MKMRYTEEDMRKLWQYVVNGAKEIMLGGHDNIGSFEEYIETNKPVNIDVGSVSGSFCKGDYLKCGKCTKSNCDYWQ